MSITFYLLTVAPLLVLVALAWRGTGERTHTAVARGEQPAVADSRRAEAA